MDSVNSINQNELVPLKFQLSQNYPNPFKDWTMIKYCLPVKSNVKLTVLSSKGEIIEQLVNEIQKAGTYEAKFDKQKISSGEYLYVMEAIDIVSGFQKNFSDTKKMRLL